MQAVAKLGAARWLLGCYLGAVKPLTYRDCSTGATLSIKELFGVKKDVEKRNNRDQVAPYSVSCKSLPHTYAGKSGCDYKAQAAPKSHLAYELDRRMVC